MTNPSASTAGDSIEPIKRVTQTEAQVQAKVAQLRDADKGQLDQLQRETDSLLLQARVQAEREREATLSSARAAGDSEAESILAEGTARADLIRGKSAAELGRLKESILRAVLSEFRTSGK